MIESSESPLAAIRDAERAAAERIAAARAETAEAVRDARRRAAQLVSEAEERGRHVANRRHREEITAAEAEAERILEEGTVEASQVEEAAAPYVKAAIDALVDLVLPAHQDREG